MLLFFIYYSKTERSLAYNEIQTIYLNSHVNVLMAFFFVFASTCFAQTPSPSSISSTVDENEENEDTPWYRIDIKIGKMFEAIKEITESIRSFLEDGLTGVVENKWYNT